MKIRRICNCWDYLYEVPLLTNGHDVSTNWGLQIYDLIEQQKEWETYLCKDVRDNQREVKIKVYRDNFDINSKPNLHIGYKETYDSDFNPDTSPKDCFIYEVVEGDYEAATHPDKFPVKEEPEDVPEEKNGSSLMLCQNDETGEECVFDSDTCEFYYKRTSTQKKTAEPAKKDENKPKGFACVAGMHELKEQLNKEVLFPLRNKDVMELYKLHPLNGMLLHGHPGCGKTFIAEKFAEESGMNFEKVSSGSLSGKYIHETANHVKEMFDRARQKAPCVLCIDEIDAICPSRSGMEGGGGSDWVESVNEFLSQMNNCSKDGIFVIGTTNNPQLIDEALLRTGRMDKIICIPMPDEECRHEMLEMYLKDRPQDENIDLDSLAKLTDGMTASDIECMVNAVAMEAAYTLSDITYEALAEQAKTQRRSGEMVAKPALKPVAKTTKEAIPRIVGFSKVG